MGCSSEPGLEGTEILVPYGALSGGMLLSTSAIQESRGYDLFWVPVPPVATIDPQPILRLTFADGNEWQPSVSRGGNGIVFAREDDGIFLINTSGRVSRVSTSGNRFKDSIPAISPDGARVAWVREDRSRPIGESGFFETSVMIANYDGSDAREALPRAGVVQDAPVFDPNPASLRVAWSEFNAITFGPGGPTDFGIWVHNYQTDTGRYACQSPPIYLGDRSRPYRCFGQHLTWVAANGASFIVTGQDLLEINVDTGELSTIWPELIVGLQSQQSGIPDIGDNPSGFFPRFPLSVSYARNLDRLVFDGIVQLVDGDDPTLAFFSAAIDGGGAWRIPIDGYAADVDQFRTGDYTFSLATPQLVP